MKVALRESTHPQEGICSYKNQECLVYWRTGVPKNVVFEKGSGVVLYNMFETTSRFGETLYRTPTKADDDSLDSTVICYIWVRKDGFLTTNLTRTLNMRTELELAQLAREESVGSFEKTKIPRWKRFDLKHLKNLCPANASSNTNWLSNTSRHREKTSPKTENGNVCELTKKVSTGDEYHRLSDDQPSEAPLRESFPTPIALDAKVKLPVQSHTGNYFNDRYSKLLDWKTSDNLGKYKARGSRKFCASSDLWKGVSSLGSLQTDPIDISDNRAPESESFIPSDEKHLRYPVKCQNRTTESKNGVEQAFKPSDIEVITISDDDDDTPLNRGKLSEDNAVNKHHSSSSYPMPSSFEARQESKPIPPNAKLVVVSPASKGKAIPKKSSHTASSMASGEAPSFSQSQPTPTSETPPPLHLNSPAEKLDNLEAHYGPWKLRGAIDMISFIPSEEKHDQQRVNHIHYILTRNFRYTNHRFEWRKGHRELFDKDPELENPRTKEVITKIYDLDVIQHRRRFLKYKQTWATEKEKRPLPPVSPPPDY